MVVSQSVITLVSTLRQRVMVTLLLVFKFSCGSRSKRVDLENTYENEMTKIQEYKDKELTNINEEKRKLSITFLILK